MIAFSQYKVPKGTFSTHTSMGSIISGYNFNRDTAFGVLNYGAVNKLVGLAEKSASTSMLRIDLDFKTKDGESVDLAGITKDCIDKVRNYLNKYMIKESFNNTDACVLTKPSYINPENGLRKHGIHIVYPNIFISKEHFKILEGELKPLIKGFDSISSNPWLIYGQQKNEYSGSYKAGYVDVEGNRVSASTYFKNYKIYGTDERVIKYTEPIETYYGAIFSILPLNRECSEFTVPEAKEIPARVKPVRKPDDRPIEEIETEVRLLVKMLNDDRADGRDTWLEVGWALNGVNEGFLHIWKEFSKRSDKYDENVCDYQWDRMEDKGLKMGSLHYYAGIDSPTEYKAYKATKASPYMETSLGGSHKDIALVFNELFGNDNVKVTDNKELGSFIWNDKTLLWEEKTKPELRIIVSDVCVPSYEEIGKEIIKKIGECRDKGQEAMLNTRLKQVQKMVGNLKAIPYLDNICKAIGGYSIDKDFESKVINKSKHELPLKNGKIINFKTKEVRDRMRDDYWSFECPVEYDPELDTTCVNTFFNSITCNDKDLKNYFQMLCGYLMTGETGDRSIHILFGEGCNGKSSLINIIQNILGNFYTGLSDDFNVKKTSKGATPELMALMFARCATLPESDKKEILNSKKIKTVTGDDAITARHLFGHQTTFKTQSKLLWATNHKPKIDVEDKAILDRIKLIPFNARFEKTKENTAYIKDLQTNKLNEFFNWFCVGAYTWYNGDGLEPSKSMKDAMRCYIADNDIVAEFAEETLVIITKDEYNAMPKLDKVKNRMKKGSIYGMFRDWVDVNNRKDEGINKKEFNKSFGKVCESIKTGGVECYLCKMKIEEDEEDIDMCDEGLPDF